MSLRTFHFVFILIAIGAADMFGAWAVWSYSQTHDGPTLIAEVLSFLVGFGMIGYAIRVVRKLEKAKIE